MENLQKFETTDRFKTPEEEAAFIRNEAIARAEDMGQYLEHGARHVISEYKGAPAERVLDPRLQLSESEKTAVVLKLSPEAHDATMAELLGVLQIHGIKNTLDVVARMNNPHLEDDFERFLVQYLKAGYTVPKIKEGDPTFRALHMTLYEITLPESPTNEREVPLKELLSAMEQFYAGMLSVEDTSILGGPAYFTIELAVANHSDEFVFYAAVPDGKRSLFERQILSLFPTAKILEKPDDYNIFNETGVAVSSLASLEESPVFPIKTYDAFDHDPLAVLLNSFTKIQTHGEGAVIQLVVKPTADRYLSRFNYALKRLKDGVKTKEAVDMPESVFEHFTHFAKDLVTSRSKNDPGKFKEPPKLDDRAIEAVTAKVKSSIVAVNVRLVASAASEAAASAILSDLESAFNQFTNTFGNRLHFERLKQRALKNTLRDFSFRQFEQAEILPLNLKELSSLMHFPTALKRASPQLKISRSASAAVPPGMPASGTLLGVNSDRNVETRVYMLPEDRLRHFYCIGQTGTGKTTLLKNMIIQDITEGAGVCMIDPHGTDIDEILAHIPPERFNDVIYFDPSYTPRPMGLNMLEYDEAHPEQKTFVVNELLSIFKKLYGAVPESMGPAFEQYFRNATLLVIEDPASGTTLLEVSRVLANKEFRAMKLSHCGNPIVVQFWKEIAEKAGGEASLQNIVPYITNKFDVFIANEIMRPIIAQEHSSFRLRDVMDNQKILLVNLAKGRLGDINSHLLGLIMVGKILMAALSRVDATGETPPFYLYIDEFQNVTTDSIATILSEARKYKLSLAVAHQFLGQLEEKIRNAVFGNVGSLAAFRVGAEDAEFLEKQFSPVFSGRDLLNLDNHNAYMKLLSGGKTVRPFNIETLTVPQGERGQIEKLKELSYQTYGRPREEVEKEVLGKYAKEFPKESPTASELIQR